MSYRFVRSHPTGVVHVLVPTVQPSPSWFHKLCGRGIGGQVVIAAVMELDQRPRRPCKDCARALRWRLKLEHDDLARLGFFDAGERLR